MNDNDVEIVKRWIKSPIAFVQDIWGLKPERDNEKFVKGKNVSAQQHDILLAVEKALRGEGSRKISIASGHGIGKTAVISWLLLWFLFTNEDAQVACTAPTSQQMYDILWKEVNKWIRKMPKEIGNLYEWTTSYVRIKEKPEVWFARAATARKEAPEALAGIHGDAVMILADEASGIDDAIFDSARGALTEKNIFVILISNPTRLIGYFYETHNRLKNEWQTLQFSSLDSPLVSEESELISEIKNKYGEDSDEYRIRVLGLFPREDSVDEKGFVPLFIKADLKYISETDFQNRGYITGVRLGVDPSGEGDDKTAFVMRDKFLARIEGEEAISTPLSIAERTLTLMVGKVVRPENVFIDDFGVGSKTVQEVALAEDGGRINAVNVGNKARDEDRFQNIRAEAYFVLREWLRSGGELVYDPRWEELLTIKYKRALNGKLQIMSKDEMRRQGIDSQNFADALMLTFVKEDRIFGSGSVKQTIPTKSGIVNR